MSSINCKLHRDTKKSFCLGHGIYCCATCHAFTYPGCLVQTIDDAISHFREQLEMSAVKIYGVVQNYKNLKTSLQGQYDDAQHQNGAAIACITTFFDRLQSTVEDMRRKSVEKIRSLTEEQSNTLKAQLDSLEGLEDFLHVLEETVHIDDVNTDHPETSHSCSLDPYDLVNLNMRTVEIHDGLASARTRLSECSSEERNFSIVIEDDPTINEQLTNQLATMCESIGKSPEGCCKSALVDIPVASSSDHVSSVEECLSDLVVTPRYFRKVTEFSHPGTDQVVRYIRPSLFLGLNVLIASKEPCKITYTTADGCHLLTEKTKTTIYDIYCRNKEVFAAANDQTIRVYQLNPFNHNLRLIRQIPTIECCGRVVRTDHDFVVSFPFTNNLRVSRMEESGVVTHTSSYKFGGCICNIIVTSNGDRVLVSASDTDNVDAIVILSKNLSTLTKVTHPEIVGPRGMCLVDSSIFVACIESNSIIELNSDGRFKGTVLGTLDGLERPYALSYDSESKKLIVSSDLKSKNVLVFNDES